MFYSTVDFFFSAFLRKFFTSPCNARPGMIKHRVFPASLSPLLPILHVAADQCLLIAPGLGDTSCQQDEKVWK